MTPSIPSPSVSGDELRVTLVNHSTVLLQQNGANILTDPVWSRRVSPVPWAGPRRHREPGIRKEDLPAIDIVMLSHNHYDHLDLSMLRWLAKHRSPEFVVPRGVGRLLRSQGMNHITELDWGDAQTFGAITITGVTALHFSGRGLFDRNRTLWCGYVIASENSVVYFAGDTAFGSHFATIREQFGAPRLSLLPIGAYEPRWFMGRIHMSPAEALHAHHILQSGTGIAIHHGTFQLADDAVDTPSRLIREAGPPASFLILNNGDSVSVPKGVS